MPRRPGSYRPKAVNFHAPYPEFEPGPHLHYPSAELLEQLQLRMSEEDQARAKEAREAWLAVLEEWAKERKRSAVCWADALDEENEDAPAPEAETPGGGGNEAGCANVGLPTDVIVPQVSVSGVMRADSNPANSPTLRSSATPAPPEVAVFRLVPGTRETRGPSDEESEAGERERRERRGSESEESRASREAVRELHRCLEAIEEREKVDPRPERPEVSQGRRGRTSLPIKTRGVIFGNLKPIMTDPVRDPPPRVCFNCWQSGHSRRACPRPLRRGYCLNCGRRGEELSQCPRCAERYWERHREWRGSRSQPESEVASLQPPPPAKPEEVVDVPLPLTPRNRVAQQQLLQKASVGMAPTATPPSASLAITPPPQSATTPTPLAPTSTPRGAWYALQCLADVLRETKDLDPTLRHQVIQRVLDDSSSLVGDERSLPDDSP